MSSISYTTSALIDSIKRKGSFPSNQSLFSDTDFVEILDGELRTYVIPFVLKAREEYFVTSEDFSIVSGTASYEIPSKAIGKKLRALYTVSSTGDLVEIPRLNPEDIAIDRRLIRPYGYYLQGDNVILYPTPTTAGTLRMFYYKRPNKLVVVDNAAKIASVNTGTYEVTLESLPTSWTTLTSLDVIDKDPSFKTKLEGFTSATVSGVVITVTSAQISYFEAGDYIAESGESPIPQIPVECLDLLVQSSIVKCLEAMGDQTGGYQAAATKLAQLEGDILEVVSQRVEGNPKKITNNRGLWKASKVRYWNV